MKVPSEIEARIKGGAPETEKEGAMWGDAIQVL